MMLVCAYLYLKSYSLPIVSSLKMLRLPAVEVMRLFDRKLSSKTLPFLTHDIDTGRTFLYI